MEGGLEVLERPVGKKERLGKVRVSGGPGLGFIIFLFGSENARAVRPPLERHLRSSALLGRSSGDALDL